MSAASCCGSSRPGELRVLHPKPPDPPAAAASAPPRLRLPGVRLAPGVSGPVTARARAITARRCFPPSAVCEQGHFVCDACHTAEALAVIRQICQATAGDGPHCPHGRDPPPPRHSPPRPGTSRPGAGRDPHRLPQPRGRSNPRDVRDRPRPGPSRARRGLWLYGGVRRRGGGGDCLQPASRGEPR